MGAYNRNHSTSFFKEYMVDIFLNKYRLVSLFKNSCIIVNTICMHYNLFNKPRADRHLVAKN